MPYLLTLPVFSQVLKYNNPNRGGNMAQIATDQRKPLIHHLLLLRSFFQELSRKYIANLSRN
jgi:hypothetical protein